MEPADGSALSGEERAAARAYLQRSEVRLSTMHRVATALLSGAGLLVLLPAVERDAVVEVLGSLVSGEVTGIDVLLIVGTTVSLLLPFTALWLLLRDLTRFYFHGLHVERGDGSESFVPRFTLTGLRLPGDEMGPAARAGLDAERGDQRAIELLVPANDAGRRRIDRRVDAYGGLGVGPIDGDHDRARALLVLAASRDRTLLEEVAKVEYGMARHVLRVQSIVLRYVKALLALLTTAAATFAAAAVVDGGGDLTTGDRTWLAAILVLWAPAIVIAVASPVRWLDRQLRNEGATETAVARDPDLTQLEGVTIRLALVSFVVAGIALVLCLAGDDLTTAGRVAGGAALAVAGLVLGAAMRFWGVHRAAGGGRRGPVRA